MALDLPVVATRIGGTSEALGGGLCVACRAGRPGGVREMRSTSALERRARAAASANAIAAATSTIHGRANGLWDGRRSIAPSSQKGRTGMTTDGTPTRIGFVGAGGIADRHVGTLGQMQDVAIVGFADVDVDRAPGRALKVGARAYASHQDLMRARTARRRLHLRSALRAWRRRRRRWTRGCPSSSKSHCR